MFTYFIAYIKIIQNDTVKAYDGIHRCTNLMTHIRQESCLGLICLFSRRQSFLKSSALFHCLSGLAIHIYKARPYSMHYMIFPVLRMPHSRKTYLFIGVYIMAMYHIAIRYYSLFFKPFTNTVRLNKVYKFLLIFILNGTLGILLQLIQIIKSVTGLQTVFDSRMLLVAHAFAGIQLQVIYTPVVRCKCSYKSVLLFSQFLLIQQLLLKGKPVFKFRLLDTILCFYCFLFKNQIGIAAHLTGYYRKHDKQNRRCQK